jgi:hypothetical protein
VLLARGAGVDLALLVGADRLVLDAVVGGELAAAQRDERGRERDRGDGGLAAHPARAAAQDGAGGRGGGHGGEHRRILEGQLRLGQRAPDQRDHGHRLAEAHHPAQAREASGAAAHARLAPGGHGDRAVVAAHGRRPVLGAVDEQAVAQGHAAELELLVRLSHRAAPS